MLYIYLFVLPSLPHLPISHLPGLALQLPPSPALLLLPSLIGLLFPRQPGRPTIGVELVAPPLGRDCECVDNIVGNCM